MNRHLEFGTTALLLAACSPQVQTQQTAPAVAAAPAPAAAAATASLSKDPLLAGVGIGVSDLDRSETFYTETMGMKVTNRYTTQEIKEVVVAYPEGETAIALVHWIDGSYGAYKNLPVKVIVRTKDPLALATKIKAAGGTVTHEPVPDPSKKGAIVGFAKDPDGYILELLPLLATARSAPSPAAISGAAQPTKSP